MSKQAVYGFPCVTNPHDFDPDHECCSPAEIEAHRLAKANWGKPAFAPNKGCYSEYDASGQLVKHVTRTSWGIGVNLLDSCDDCREPTFDEPTIYCHDCARDLCSRCWPEHERKHDEGGI
jgi:hypothetical protein